MLFKMCNSCCKEQTIECFSKSKKGKYGVRAECKGCVAEKRKANKEAIDAQRAIYLESNREAIAAQKKKYREANKEAILEQNKQYYQANKQAHAIHNKQYREANREAIAARLKQWQQDNPDKVNTINAHRRANKLQATPVWADNEAITGMYQLAAIFNRTGINLHVDHIVPLKSNKVCGLHCEDNLQLLPATENISKGNRYWDDMWQAA